MRCLLFLNGSPLNSLNPSCVLERKDSLVFGDTQGYVLSEVCRSDCSSTVYETDQLLLLVAHDIADVYSGMQYAPFRSGGSAQSVPGARPNPPYRPRHSVLYSYRQVHSKLIILMTSSRFFREIGRFFSFTVTDSLS